MRPPGKHLGFPLLLGLVEQGGLVQDESRTDLLESFQHQLGLRQFVHDVVVAVLTFSLALLYAFQQCFVHLVQAYWFHVQLLVVSIIVVDIQVLLYLLLDF